MYRRRNEVPVPDNGADPTTALSFHQLSGPSELAAASDLLAEVFGAPPESMPVDLLTAIVCAGGFVGGAILDQRLVGVAVGFGEIGEPGSAGPPGLHSHVAAVSDSARGLRVGQQLKWYQRSWALQRGIEVIHWTFDPLVRRNAVLNINRLGAVVSTYHENLYGSIPDALNAGMESDRLLVRWELDSQRARAAQRKAVGTAEKTDLGADGVEHGTGRPPVHLIDTPPDIESLVRADLSAAQAWRERQRQAFRELPQGWIVTGIDAEGRYQVEVG